MPPDSPQNEEIVLRVESRQLFSDVNVFWCICDGGQSVFSNIKSTDIKSYSPKCLPGSQLMKTFSFPPLQRPVMLTRRDPVHLWIAWHTHVYNVMKMPRLHPSLSTFISATEKLLCVFSWIWSVNSVKQPWMSFLNLFVKLVSGFNLKEAVKQLPSSCRWTCTGWFCFCGLCGIRNLIRWSAVVEGFSFFITLLNQKTLMWFSTLGIMNRPPVIAATAATPGCRVAISLKLQAGKVRQESWGAHQSLLEQIILL